MKVQEIRRGYGYLFNAGLFLQFHATVNTLSVQFTFGKWTRGTRVDSFQRHALKRGVFNKKRQVLNRPVARKAEEIA